MESQVESTSNQLPEQTAGTSTAEHHYTAVYNLLTSAVSGDPEAISQVISFLGSGNPDLRKMMLVSLHECEEERIWRQLLSCLAHQCWSGDVPAGEVTGGEIPSTTTLPPIMIGDAHTQTIAEAFVIDLSQAEQSLKDKLLQDELASEDERIRFACAYLRGLRGDPAMIPLLDEMIESGEPLWQMRAIQALVVIHEEDCGAPLIKALARYDQPKMGRELHQEARRAIFDLGRAGVPALLEALTHPDSHIRWHAARSLGQIGDARGADQLAEGLYDQSQAVRWATANVLAELGTTAIPAVLKVLSQHPLDEPFRQAAYHALHAMVSPQIQSYLQPLLEALRNPAGRIQAPQIAQRMLAHWNNTGAG